MCLFVVGGRSSWRQVWVTGGCGCVSHGCICRCVGIRGAKVVGASVKWVASLLA